MRPDLTRNRASRALLTAAAFTVLASVPATIARAGYAQTGNGGGVGAPTAPRPADAVCVNRCLDLRVVAIGGKVQITGQNLQNVTGVYFPGRSQTWVKTEAKNVGPRSVLAKVPDGATSGQPAVADGIDQSAVVPASLEIKPRSAVSKPRGFKFTRTKITPKKSYVGGRKPKATYVFKAKAPVDVRLDIIHKPTGKIVDSIVKPDQKPFQTHKAKWSGKTADGKEAKSGGFKIKVHPLAGGESAKVKFQRYDHIFPLAAKKHKYGDGLGAGRNHQGQDVFAKCGTPVRAARGGKVRYSKYGGRAGYYVTIDGAKNKIDYFYMHLQRKGRVKKGTRVRTGQVIGYNGATGNASGCHVHFEMRKGAGWGGKVINPTPHLRRWDRWS